MAAKKVASKKTIIKKEESEKVQIEVLKGFGCKFGSDKIKDGSVLRVAKWVAADLLKKKFVKLK